MFSMWPDHLVCNGATFLPPNFSDHIITSLSSATMGNIVLCVKQRGDSSTLSALRSKASYFLYRIDSCGDFIDKSAHYSLKF